MLQVSEPEQKERFEAKQIILFSVSNASLQTDMGKTIVRRHLTTTELKQSGESSVNI